MSIADWQEEQDRQARIDSLESVNAQLLAACEAVAAEFAAFPAGGVVMGNGPRARARVHRALMMVASAIAKARGR